MQDDTSSSTKSVLLNLGNLFQNLKKIKAQLVTLVCTKKMPNEHFCLKWNNFQRNIVAALGNLKVDEDFVDVTISCEGKLIKAHKVILSACSDYFRDLFRVSI